MPRLCVNISGGYFDQWQATNKQHSSVISYSGAFLTCKLVTRARNCVIEMWVQCASSKTAILPARLLLLRLNTFPPRRSGCGGNIRPVRSMPSLSHLTSAKASFEYKQPWCRGRRAVFRSLFTRTSKQNDKVHRYYYRRHVSYWIFPYWYGHLCGRRDRTRPHY